MVSQRLSRVIAGVACFFFFITAARLFHSRRFELQPAFENPAPAVQIPESSQPTPPDAEPPQMAQAECHTELGYLVSPQLDLNRTTKFSRRCIKPNYGNHDRNTIDHVAQPLITKQTTLNLTSCPDVKSPPCESLSLDVTNAYPAKQYPHLIFGIASSYQRVHDALPAFAHWSAGTNARFIGIITDVEDDKSAFNLTALEALFAAKNILATFEAPHMERLKTLKFVGDKAKEGKEGLVKTVSDVPVEQHHHMLVRDLLEYATEETQWLGVLDDDTFFPSLYPLDEALSKYDHTKSTWLGGLTEDFDKVKQWGFMAFGGAGTFLSLPLARQVEPHLVQCINESEEHTGDAMLKECIWKHTRTRLTILPGLNQLDLLWDPSGFFESGISPISLHHYLSWFHEPVPAQAVVSALCGSCYLQRWRFGKDTVFTNGFSINVYSDGLDAVDLNKTEETWGEPKRTYEYNLGPLRPKIPEDKKKNYRLKDTQTLPNGDLRQLYVHKGKEVDEVVELLWEKGA
jgi:hypothetical protein